VNFKQPSYDVIEDRGEVEIEMRFSLLPSKLFEVMISSMDITANG